MKESEVRKFNELVNKKVAEKLIQIADNLPTTYLGTEGIARNLINKEVKAMLKAEVSKLTTK